MLNFWEIPDMPTNPILEEIYAAREKLLADAGGDVKRYLQGVREREQASGRLIDVSQQSAKHRTDAPCPPRSSALPSAKTQ